MPLRAGLGCVDAEQFVQDEVSWPVRVVKEARLGDSELGFRDRRPEFYRRLRKEDKPVMLRLIEEGYRLIEEGYLLSYKDLVKISTRGSRRIRGACRFPDRHR